jgi:AAA domain, putative AbiEii toxin, Type IV TA system
MRIKVVEARSEIVPGDADYFLVRDHWDDWFEFETQYRLLQSQPDMSLKQIGDVKIGQTGMIDGQRRPSIPKTFSALPEEFFSVGQDDSYYESIKELGRQAREEFLLAMRDIAASAELFESALAEPVTRRSLLRSVTATTVRGQFRRMARGDARLTEYRFEYNRFAAPGTTAPGMQIDFRVKPESSPPTNAHILIGRNGVGKTHLLGGMTRALMGGQLAEGASGAFNDLTDGAEELFAGLVTVSFSAFDSLPPLSRAQLSNVTRGYAYIGLSQVTDTGELLSPKAPADLQAEFVASARLCSRGARAERWLHTLRTLESDPMFQAAEASSLLQHEDDSLLDSQAADLFSSLSSGHKIVLLTVTRLVELVEERTLVLLDEPESHLHPPLLSAFVTALSNLLTQRNGVAIVATHSPVILQEVPRSCVWKLRRSGPFMYADRPERETFGENVGVLTHEVFGLEVTTSGFYEAIAKRASEDQSYSNIDASFGGQIGSEGRAIARALIAARDSERAS